MRPSLAFGPIDSVTQYLLYLSVVVLGILLPLAIQRWVKARQEAQLLAATRAALADEIAENRRKVLKSRDTFASLAALLDDEIGQYRAIWSIRSQEPEGTTRPERPKAAESPITYAAPIRTAWEIAGIRQALPLLPAHVLAAYARAYQLQLGLDQERGIFLAVAMRANALEAPADLSVLRNIERRIETLLELQAISKHHAALTQSLVDAYDEVLSRDSGHRAAQ